MNKKREIELLISQEIFDILLFTEIWIGDGHDASEIFLPGFQAPIIDPKIRGGACAFVRSGLNFYTVEPPQKVTESIWFCINTIDNIRRLYACIYRSPNSTAENNDKLIENLNWAKNSFSEVVIVGDFNFPYINWQIENSSETLGQKLLDTLNDNFLEQLIDEPTRYREGQNPSLLDLLIVSTPDMISDIKYCSPLGKSDHVTICYKVQNKMKKNN